VVAHFRGPTSKMYLFYIEEGLLEAGGGIDFGTYVSCQS
jgi:hypothetical protein